MRTLPTSHLRDKPWYGYPKTQVIIDVRNPGMGKGWMVLVDGWACSPSWDSKVAAQAYADAIVEGKRQPEFSDERIGGF